MLRNTLADAAADLLPPAAADFGTLFRTLVSPNRVYNHRTIGSHGLRDAIHLYLLVCRFASYVEECLRMSPGHWNASYVPAAVHYWDTSCWRGIVLLSPARCSCTRSSANFVDDALGRFLLAIHSVRVRICVLQSSIPTSHALVGD